MPSGEKGAYHLWNTNAEEVEITDSGKLEEQLFREKVPYGITRGSNSVRYERLTPAGVNEGRIVLDLQGNMSAIFRGLKVLAPENKLDDSVLI